MEFLDEETRPRFLFQSRSTPPSHPQPPTPSLHKPSLFISLPLSTLLFSLSLLFPQPDPLQSILFWFALSLLLGPFAPSSLTAGHIRVGQGKLLEPPSLDLDAPIKKTPNRRSRPRKPDELGFNPGPETVAYVKNGEGLQQSSQLEGGRSKMNDADSFARFLKDRKPVDKRVEEESGEAGAVESGEVMRESVSWSGGDDVALLNALKAFPKDVPMRWEKITAAVPGKSKAACMKRVAELKKGFRSSKASAEA